MCSVFGEELYFARHCQENLREACFISVTHIWTSEREYLPLSQMGSADETSVFFYVPSIHTVDNVDAKSMVIQTWGYKKDAFNCHVGSISR